LPVRDDGSTLLYVTVLLLVFSVLGIAMVSLFTTASTSSATPNDARRAMYMTESGMRFAMTKLRKSGFSQSTVDELNSRTYTINNGGNFTFNVFGPWFDAASDQNLAAGGTLALVRNVGDIPALFDVPAGSSVINVVNFDYTGWFPAEPGGIAEVTVLAGQTPTALNITVSDEFVANENELICFAVAPYNDQADLDEGDSLVVELAAKDIFPRHNGAVNINREEFYYEELIVHGNTNVELTKLSKMPASSFPLTVSTTDYVILSPRNYLVIPTGQSGGVSHGGDLNAAINVANRGLPPPGSRAPDIEAEELTNNITAPASDPDFIDVDTLNDEINIGGGTSGPDFGAAWYDADKAIGGKTGFCQAGACEFGMGIRVFFVVDVSNQGDGFTFALINAADNDTTSAGGDIELGELLGYAGDSRLVESPTDPTDADHFLDPSPSLADKGLLPPKMALEFDLYENSGVNDYCVPSTEGVKTRNDPTASLLVDTEAGEEAIHRDLLQYVFWGSTELQIACKTPGNPGTYDDNRHDPMGTNVGVWVYPTDFPAATADPIEKVKSDPTVGPDGTIYFGSDDDKVYALNPDGSEKWISPPTGNNVQSSPTVDDRGTSDPADDIIYVGSNSDHLHAFNTSGSQLWSFDTGGNVKTKPAVGPDGMVYLGSDGDKFFALNPTYRKQNYDNPGSKPFPQSGEWEFATGGHNVKSSASINHNNTPGDISDDTIYVGTDKDRIYAFNQGDRATHSLSGGKWFPTANEWYSDTGGNAQAGTAVGADGMVYVGADCCDFWAFNHNDRAEHTKSGGKPHPTENEWEYPPGGSVIDDVRGAPVLAADGTVYFGAAAGHDKGKVYALDAGGNLLWDFDTEGEVFTRPALSHDDSTIFVGTEKSKVYALNTDDRQQDHNLPGSQPFPSENEWEFTADGKVRAPAVGTSAMGNTIVYVGSEGSAGGLLYALAGNFAQPKNERGTFISYSDEFKLETEPPPDQEEQDDWLSYNDYAVRLEVMRSLEPNPAGKYEYTLHAWVRRCEFADCTDADITGSDAFFHDTRIQYSWFPAPNSFMKQTIKLEEDDHLKLERILFGFTGATGSAGAQNAVIKEFRLSFIRPNDPVVTDDSGNWEAVTP